MNNFSNQYFGKNLDELNYEDLVRFFSDEREESDKIEFKSYQVDGDTWTKKIDGVIRGICAFLNSGGGLMIWGAPSGTKVADRVVFTGHLAMADVCIDKDRLISKISDSITPLPININVHTIEHAGFYLYVFDILASNYSPHQYRNIYYARLDGQTKPAPHYLVDALFKKISYPNIEGFINLEGFGNNGFSENYLDLSIIIINFSELQNEFDVSYRLICPQAIFADSRILDHQQYYTNEGHTFIHKGEIDVLFYGAPDRHRERIVFNMETLERKFGNELDLYLSFGGRQSPLKYSNYKLRFRGPITTNNPVELFVSIEENIMAVTKTQELGTTREKLLSEILLRPHQ